MTFHPGTRPAITIFLVLLAALFPAIGAPASDTETPEPLTEAELVLRQASDRLADTQTLKFELDIKGDTFIDSAGAIRLAGATGSLARPDKVDVEFQVELLGTQTVSIRMIAIGEEAWTTDLLSGAWGPSPDEFGYNPAILFDNQDGLGPVAGRLESPTIDGEEEIAGRDTWKVSGTVDSSVIAPMTSGNMQGDGIRVTLWVDQESADILRLEVAEPDDVDKENPATWTMTLTDHDADIRIDPPDVEE